MLNYHNPTKIMMQLRYLPFLLVLLIPLNSAYGSVTLQNTQIVTNNATIQVVDQLTVDQITVAGTGVTTRSISTDNMYLYNIYRTGGGITDWDFTKLDSNSIEFQRNTAGIDDANIDATLGPQMFDSFVDGSSFGIDWDGVTNHVRFLSGSIIELFFTDSGSGGGGGSGGSISGSGGGTTDIVDIILNTDSHYLSLGEPEIGELTFTWNSGEDLLIDSIILDDTPIHFSFDIPILLAGSGNNATNSRGIIQYTVQSPENRCRDGVTADCVNETIYPNTFILGGSIGERSLSLSGGIEVDTRLIPAILSNYMFLFVGFIAVGVIAFMFASQNKTNAKNRVHPYQRVHHTRKRIRRKSTSIAKQLEKTR